MDHGEGYDPTTYGAHVADIYDQMYRPDDTAVACLAGLAGAGPVLELAIGTGRLALPLAAAGPEVHGIDASPAMVGRLRAKPGGETIPVTIGDFADVAVAGEYSLVFVALNTFFVLPTAQEQARCFRNVARRLAPGGRFVIEAFVPDPSRFVRGHRADVAYVSGGVRINASWHDTSTQRIASLVLWLSPAGLRSWPVHIRYSYPAELDAMTLGAGLGLEHRWSGWERRPYTPDCPRHVSVYVRDPERKPSSSAAHRSGSRR
ncbi:MAG TPA: class I SAM-dependent methyltransferase [Acidimicrobiia bacterium]